MPCEMEPGALAPAPRLLPEGKPGTSLAPNTMDEAPPGGAITRELDLWECKVCAAATMIVTAGHML